MQSLAGVELRGKGRPLATMGRLGALLVKQDQVEVLAVEVLIRSDSDEEDEEDAGGVTAGEEMGDRQTVRGGGGQSRVSVHADDESASEVTVGTAMAGTTAARDPWLRCCSGKRGGCHHDANEIDAVGGCWLQLDEQQRIIRSRRKRRRRISSTMRLTRQAVGSSNLGISLRQHGHILSLAEQARDGAQDQAAHDVAAAVPAVHRARSAWSRLAQPGIVGCAGDRAAGLRWDWCDDGRRSDGRDMSRAERHGEPP